jgi:uncharacterized protein (DUF4415 family)
MKKPYERPLTPEELAAMPDEEIDYADIPELDDRFFEAARLLVPTHGKRMMTLRIDGDVVDWFKARGPGYQSRMNAVLRAYVKSRE